MGSHRWASKGKKPRQNVIIALSMIFHRPPAFDTHGHTIFVSRVKLDLVHFFEWWPLAVIIWTNDLEHRKKTVKKKENQNSQLEIFVFSI